MWPMYSTSTTRIYTHIRPNIKPRNEDDGRDVQASYMGEKYSEDRIRAPISSVQSIGLGLEPFVLISDHAGVSQELPILNLHGERLC